MRFFQLRNYGGFEVRYDAQEDRLESRKLRRETLSQLCGKGSRSYWAEREVLTAEGGDWQVDDSLPARKLEEGRADARAFFEKELAAQQAKAAHDTQPVLDVAGSSSAPVIGGKTFSREELEDEQFFPGCRLDDAAKKALKGLGLDAYESGGGVYAYAVFEE